MKKWLIAILLIGVGFFSIEAPAQAQEKVIWDGAEIVKDQTGKMTFTKDIKVYKKVSSGKFVSIIVKKGNYFRAYNIEKYDGKVYYWMSGGYRVQSTDLVVFKAMPIEIRGEFFKNPFSVNISRNPIDVNFEYADAVGSPPVKQKINVPYGELLFLSSSCLQCYHNPRQLDSGYMYLFNDPTDIKLVESTALAVPRALYKVKEDTLIYDNPFGVKTANAISVEKDTLVESYFYIINDNIQMSSNSRNHLYSYIPMSKLEKAK